MEQKKSVKSKAAKTVKAKTNAAKSAPKLSVVVPCYNEEEGLDELHTRLSKACADVFKNSYELIYVNDGSKDATWQKICEKRKHSPHVKGISLSRNFGHSMALTAGLDKARGDYILIIDADLQDPPELLVEMYDKIKDGADVVYGQRKSRDGESYFKTATASFFYRLLNYLSDYKMPVDTGDFRLMKRKVLDGILSMPEYSRYTRGMVAWVGFNQQPVLYHRDKRFAGTTEYTLKKMVKLALDALTGFTNKPLRLSFYLAFFSMIIFLFLMLYSMYSYFIGDTIVGWTSLAMIVTFSMGIQCFLIGLLGEYIGRIYDEAKGRPKYIVNEEV